MFRFAFTICIPSACELILLVEVVGLSKMFKNRRKLLAELNGCPSAIHIGFYEVCTRDFKIAFSVLDFT